MNAEALMADGVEQPIEVLPTDPDPDPDPDPDLDLDLERFKGAMGSVSGPGTRRRTAQIAGKCALRRRSRTKKRSSGLLPRAPDVFVFASRTETQGLVLLEAMALGVPVVSTALMGSKAVPDKSGGAMAAPDNVGAFTAAATSLLRSYEGRQKLSAAAVEDVARRWSGPEMARRRLNLYSRIIRT
jgi:glycosyltransferase involved in cell wall biosynthesis